jgi:hypothetical protein
MKLQLRSHLTNKTDVEGYHIMDIALETILFYDRTENHEKLAPANVTFGPPAIKMAGAISYW